MVWHKSHLLRTRLLGYLLEYYQEEQVSVTVSTTRVNYHSSLPTSRDWNVNKATRDKLRNDSTFPETQPRDDTPLPRDSLWKKQTAIWTEREILCPSGGESLNSGKDENDTNLSRGCRGRCQRGPDTRSTERCTVCNAGKHLHRSKTLQSPITKPKVASQLLRLWSCSEGVKGQMTKHNLPTTTTKNHVKKNKKSLGVSGCQLVKHRTGQSFWCISCFW